MLVMAVLADYLAIVMPEQIPNLFIGTFTIYLVATAWLTVRRNERSVGLAEKIALIVILCLVIPFAILSFQLAIGLTPSFKSATPLEGPVRIAIYCFTFFVAVAAIGDVRLVLAGGITGARRIGRHLWRMCFSTRFRGRFSVHQRIATATPEDSACSANPLVYSSIDLARAAGLLGRPRALHALVYRF